MQPTDHRWFQVDKYSSGNMFSCASFTEESVERIVTASNGLVAGHLAIGLNSMLQTVQFPTGITNLHSGLANMNWNTLTLWKFISKN